MLNDMPPNFTIKMLSERADKRREEEELESLYRAAIGVEDFSATPLGTSQQNGAKS